MSDQRDTPWTESDFAAETNVSRETLAAYAAWNDLLIRWNKRINLVAPGEIPHFWRRHAYDSWQLTRFLPRDWRVLLDLGSGGGFPGIALGIAAKARKGAGAEAEVGHVHLVESVGKKTSFLKTVVRELNLPVSVHNARIEDLPPFQADILTARAFAPLPRLFDYAAPHLAEGALLILPKGEAADKELEKTRAAWTFDVESDTSLTQESASILRITGLKARP